MKVLLRPNYDKSGSVEATVRTVRTLRELGMEPMIDRADAVGPVASAECAKGELPALLAECDLVLTIGGDGTILRAVQELIAHRRNKPLLGVNTGRIGFLTQIEVDELDQLRLLSEGKYTALSRMMLEVTLIRGGVEETYHALNDVVLFRSESHLVEISVDCDTGPVATHRADGVIFSTPTGSTAYNLSAGGSIAHPSLNLIMMTAICPHSHFNRGLILSPEQHYRVREVAGNNQGGIVVTVDGMRVGTLWTGDHLVIGKSRESIPFLNLGIRDFYRCVDLKLSYRR